MTQFCRARAAVVALVAVLGLWIFAPALWGQASFALRDSARYYYPLFQWMAGEWSEGRVPLWNPLNNLGVSLVGEGTSSVFYPGKLIFVLPLDFTLAFNLYIIAHVALAAWGSYRLARRWGASVTAGGLAAMSYAFSGDVLFQVTNVVFLVGAAWLPWAMLLADRTLQQGTTYSAIGLGGILALMITGGDPQMAVNTVLLVGLYAVLLTLGALYTSPKRERGSSGERDEESLASASGLYDRDNPPCRPTTARALGLLAIAFVAAALLAAVQILPSWQSTRESARASYDAPRNVYELASATLHPTEPADRPPWYAGLVSTDPQGHAAELYQFSVGPWRAIEYLWPNVSGRQFPTFHRWLDALPAEGRVWTPSLYLGLLPFVLAISAFSLRTAAIVSTRMASWMVVFGGLASLGIYGLAWFVRETLLVFGQQASLGAGDQVGGLYWLLTVAVPGYVYFRYPAKLMIVVSLGLAMLAARGWDLAWQRGDRRLSRIFVVLAVISVAGLVVVQIAWGALEHSLSAIPPDPLFGPFDTGAARQDLTTALSHTAFLAAVFGILLSRRSVSWHWASAACLLLTAFDLAIAQAPLIAYAPAEAWSSLPATLRGLGPGTRMTRWPEDRPLPHGQTAKRLGLELRFYRDPPCGNLGWLAGGSLERPEQGVRWERNTLVPRYHLPYGVAQVEVAETLSAADELAVWQAARRHADPATGLPHASVLDLFGANEVMMPAVQSRSFNRPANDVAFDSRPSALPRAWIAHDTSSVKELHSPDPKTLAAHTEGLLFPGGRPRDWRRHAVIEQDEAIDLPTATSGEQTEDEICRVSYADPQRVEITATLVRPGLVVLRDRFDADWRLSVETNGAVREASVLRTNRLMRGAILTAGEHRLVYRYRPRGFWIGVVISASTVLACVVALAIAVIRSRGRARGTPDSR